MIMLLCPLEGSRTPRRCVYKFKAPLFREKFNRLSIKIIMFPVKRPGG